MLDRNVNAASAAIDRFLRPPLIDAPVPRGVQITARARNSELPAPYCLRRLPMATTTVSPGATSVSYDAMANAIRFLALDAVEKAKSGHPGLPMGAADVATVLWRDVLKFDAADPHWPDRDRFVLSAGHGSMMLYALIYLTGMGGDKGLTIDELEHFRQVGSKTPGHPEYGHTIGVETTTGPLGQGIATAVGMAIAERMMAARFPGIVDHHTYVLASDGDFLE